MPPEAAQAAASCREPEAARSRGLLQGASHLLTRVLPARPLLPPGPAAGSEAGGTAPSPAQQQTLHGGVDWKKERGGGSSLRVRG